MSPCVVAAIDVRQMVVGVVITDAAFISLTLSLTTSLPSFPFIAPNNCSRRYPTKLSISLAWVRMVLVVEGKMDVVGLVFLDILVKNKWQPNQGWMVRSWVDIVV